MRAKQWPLIALMMACIATPPVRADTGEWVPAVPAAEMHGVEVEPPDDNGVTTIGHCDGGDWVAYDVDLGQDQALGLEVEYGVPAQYAGQKAHVRLGSAKGQRVGTLVFPSTGEWDVFKTHSIPIDPITGTQKVCFVFSDRTGICNLRRFRFLAESPPLVANDLPTAERALIVADRTWLNESAGAAALRYAELLKEWPEAAEPFRATLTMRLARARLAAGDRDGCLKALVQLDDMAYVPEHHALAAEELRVVASGKPHPGLARTPLPPLVEADRTYHVDAAAKPNLGDGSAQNPFGTVHEAVIATRLHLRRSRSPQAIEILLAPGEYRVEKPIRLTRPDSGEPTKPVVMRSRDASDPALLTGGVTLKQWTAVADAKLLDRLPEAARGNVLVCDLNAHEVSDMGELVFGGFSSMRAEPHNHRFNTMPVPELFYDGTPQTMARWPNDGLTRIPVNEKPKTEVERFRRWAEEEDLWLYGYWKWDWADAYEKVASIEDDGTIRVEPPENCYAFTRRQGCAVNALCELDRAGEWVLDSKHNRVFYWPATAKPAGEDGPPDGFDASKCVLSAFGPVIEGNHCKYLQLRDLGIRYSRGNAVVLEDCSDVILGNLDIRNCSGSGILLHGGRRHLVHSCTVNSMGRGAIDLWAGDWQNLVSANSVVENCRISDLSRIDRTYTPALLLDGMGLTVRHCSFVDIPSSAIRVEACDALIELNYFRRCVYESGDQGAIDMWANPLYRGNVIRWNDFDRIVNPHAHYGAAAVRHDDYISGFMVAENVMRKSSPRGFGAVQFNQGTDNYVEGNIIVDWHKAFSGRSTAGARWKAVISGHPNSRRMLAETDWQSEAWKTKYPMVRSLMNGDDNHNYLVGNLRLGSGSWGGVSRALSLANRDGSGDVHGDTLDALKPHLVPWHPIPLDEIGPYDE